VPTAIRLCRSLEQAAKIDWFEEPVPVESYHALAQVREKVNAAISVGERLHTRWEFVPVFENELADYVMPDVTWTGGISEMKKIATLAAAANVTFVPHSFYFGPGLAGTLHVAASTPGVPYVEMPPGRLAAPLLREPIRCLGGTVAPPEQPGLGADPDPDVLQRYAYTPSSVRPFYLT